MKKKRTKSRDPGREKMTGTRRFISYGGGKTTLWKPVAGTDYWLRILPAIGSHPFIDMLSGMIQYPVHYGLKVEQERQGDREQRNTAVLCLKNPQDQKKCPICEYIDMCQQTGDREDEKIADDLKLSGHYLANALIRAEGRIYRVRFHKQVAEGLFEYSSEYRRFLDPEHGYDVKIKTSSASYRGSSFARQELGIISASKPVDFDGWKKSQPLTRSLDFVARPSQFEMATMLVEQCGEIEDHRRDWFTDEGIKAWARRRNKRDTQRVEKKYGKIPF